MTKNPSRPAPEAPTAVTTEEAAAEAGNAVVSPIGEVTAPEPKDGPDTADLGNGITREDY